MANCKETRVVFLANRMGGEYWVVSDGDYWEGPFTLRETAIRWAAGTAGMPRGFR